MRLVEDWLARKTWSLAERWSVRTVGVLAVGVYVVGGLLVPLVFWLIMLSRWTVLSMASWNFLATTISGLLLLVLLGVRLSARDRRLLVEWTTNLRLLSAQEFEWFVGEVLRREGWTVREVGSQEGPDGNIDLEVTRDGCRLLVQCKRWTSWLVGVDEVRKLAGALMREGLHGNAGMIVTLSEFTEHAVAEAERIGIALVDHRDLHRRAERVRRLEPCPFCRSPMVLDYSPHGWWFRCVANGCQGKRDLARAAGPAARLLTSVIGETPTR